MRRFKTLLSLLSIAIILGVVFSTGQPVQAEVAGIESAFSMVENPIAVVPTAAIASGS